MQTVLVAGGAGFIGSHLCKRLLKENFKVICVDSLLTSTGENIAICKTDKNFTFLKLDITKPLPSEIHADAVFHLASPASPNHHSKKSYHALPMETMMANSTGTLALLQFAEKNSAKFLYASSSEIYGDPLEHPQKEEYRGNVSTIGPRSVYDESKRFGETLTAYFWRSKNADTRIARIHNTYGPGMLVEDMRMIISFITSALEGKPITIFGDGNQTRSLCFVSDMVEGLFRFMFYPDTKAEVVNLGTTDEHTVLEYANVVKEIIHSKSEIVFSESLPEDDPMRRRPDISKARRLLSWEPKVTIEEGLKETIAYFKSLEISG